ncbi:MAG: response regulator [Alphaproteobacteria bacterium]|nr:response regulator [Alphaproteobacteria bacterium]
MFEKIKREYNNVFRYAQNNLFLVGILGFFGFPIYYFIWKYVYPQAYENLILRLFCSALFIPWLFANKLPSKLIRYFPAYFFFSLFVSIPFFFTYMLFANNFSDIWLMSYLVAIYLAILLIYHWWVIILMFSSCILINFFLYSFVNILPANFSGFEIKYVPVYIFAIVSGILCHRTEVKSQFKIKNMKSFGNGIAHEMRNPLNAINLVTSRIKSLISAGDDNIKKELNPEEIKEISKNLNTILGCTSRASEVIDMILANIKEKSHAEKLEFMQVADLISSAVKEYGFDDDSHRQRVSVNTNENFIIKVNKTALTYVIFNLLRNSLYYLKSNPNEYIKIYLNSKEENFNQIIVEDNGPGIPSSHIKYIFDSFYTYGKNEGTGLGLYFCKMTMESIGGSIECKSRVGKFTQFILKFPKVSNDEISKNNILFDKNDTNLVSKNILVIEEGGFLKNLAMFKEEVHRNLNVNVNFLSLLDEIVQELKSNGTYYNLMLIDYENKDICSEDLIKIIREFNKEIPILVYNAMDKAINNLFNIGVDEVISKNQKSNRYIVRSIAKWSLINKLPENIVSSLVNQNNEGKKVLLAEDNPVNRLMLTTLLKKMGFEVDAVSDGKELHDKFFKDNSQHDLLITDINMPVMNGDEVVKKIRKSGQKKSDIPIIVYSGDGEKEKIHKFLRSGINDFFIKGTDIGYLSNLIKFWVS